MEDLKVSVLIPVYNVEEYIERCARSLFEQTMTDGIEFIFVDDASPDRSIEKLLEVLNDYPARKSQVRIISHPENLGHSAVRNTAMKEARGKYLIHCDSDDYVDVEMYDTMYRTAVESDADIVGCNYFEEDLNGQREVVQDFSMAGNESIAAILSNNPRLHGYLWCRMFRKSLLQTNNISVPEGLSMLDDLTITIPAHKAAKKTVGVDRSFYHYQKRAGAVTSAFTVKSISSALKAMKHLRQYCTTPATHEGWNRAMALHSQPLITQLHTYNPGKWREATAGIPLKHFGSLLSRLSPLLVRLQLSPLNYLLIKLYRR